MERDQAIRLMQDLLRRMVEKKGSDLFITAGFPPAIKIDGRNQTSIGPDLESRAERGPGPRHHERSPNQGIRFHQGMQFCDLAAGNRALSRQRIRAAGLTGRCSAPSTRRIPTLEELELPPVLKEVVLSKRGFVILVGGTGSGKSTSLAAMVGYRNEKTRGHIRHDRGSGRVRACAQGLRRHASRGSASIAIAGIWRSRTPCARRPT